MSLVYYLKQLTAMMKFDRKLILLVKVKAMSAQVFILITVASIKDTKFEEKIKM